MPLTGLLSGALARLRPYISIVIAALMLAAGALSQQPAAAAPAEAPGRASAALQNTGAGDMLPAVAVTASNPAAAEAGPSAGSFTIARTGSIAAPLKIYYAVGGTATAGQDYVALDGSITIPAGQASAQIAVTPADDQAEEGSETVSIALSPDSAYVVVAPASAAVTIADDDTTAQEVSFYVDDPDAAETGPDTGAFIIARNGSTAAPLTVFYTVSGAAKAGQDYVALAGSATIPAHQASTTIALVPLADKRIETTEIVLLSLAPGDGYSIGSPASATVAIADGEPMPPPQPRPLYRLYLPSFIQAGAGPL